MYVIILKNTFQVIIYKDYYDMIAGTTGIMAAYADETKCTFFPLIKNNTMETENYKVVIEDAL